MALVTNNMFCVCSYRLCMSQSLSCLGPRWLSSQTICFVFVAIVSVWVKAPRIEGQDGSPHKDRPQSHQVLQTRRTECREVHTEGEGLKHKIKNMKSQFIAKYLLVQCKHFFRGVTQPQRVASTAPLYVATGFSRLRVWHSTAEPMRLHIWQ